MNPIDELLKYYHLRLISDNSDYDEFKLIEMIESLRPLLKSEQEKLLIELGEKYLKYYDYLQNDMTFPDFNYKDINSLIQQIKELK